jgi:hypothetical protein
MKATVGVRGLTALILSTGIVAVTGEASASAAPASAVTRTFSFIGKANGSTMTVVNIDSLLINARCDSRGFPVVFAFSSASAADLFGRVFDGLGRLHIIKNTTFTSRSKGVLLSTTSGDFDSTATVLFETSTGNVVSVNYAFDNSTTLNRQNVCTVFGSFIAS